MNLKNTVRKRSRYYKKKTYNTSLYLYQLQTIYSWRHRRKRGKQVKRSWKRKTFQHKRNHKLQKEFESDWRELRKNLEEGQVDWTVQK